MIFIMNVLDYRSMFSYAHFHLDGGGISRIHALYFLLQLLKVFRIFLPEGSMEKLGSILKFN